MIDFTKKKKTLPGNFGVTGMKLHQRDKNEWGAKIKHIFRSEDIPLNFIKRQYLAHNISSNEMYISFEFIILEHLSMKRNWDSANMLRKIIFHYIFMSKFLGPSIRCIALFFGPLIKLENL